MAQRARSGRQLAIELPPELLQRLKTHAAANDQPVAALVRRWIEAGLGGALKAGAAAPDATGLADRVAALEAAVAALQQQGTPRAPRTPKPPAATAGEPLELDLSPVAPKPEPLPLAGGSQIPHAEDAPAAAITTVQLAEALGVKRNSLNERIRRAGGARVGLELEGWRCVGSRAGEAGGPPRWLWEPVTAG